MNTKTSKVKLLIAAAVLAPSVALSAVIQNYTETAGANTYYTASSDHNNGQSETQKKADKCLDEARMFWYIGNARDADLSPQAAYQEVIKDNRSGFGSEFSYERIKQMINIAYFNPTFASADLSNPQVSMAIQNACMQDWQPKYQPLK